MSSVTELIICHHSEGRWDCVWAYAYTSINDDITCHDCIKHVWMYIEHNERNKINLPWLMREHIHTYIYVCTYIYMCQHIYVGLAYESYQIHSIQSREMYMESHM